MKKTILASGKIEVEKTSHFCIHIDKRCDVMRPYLVGGFRTKTGFTSTEVIDRMLEGLNGKEVELAVVIKD